MTSKVISSSKYEGETEQFDVGDALDDYIETCYLPKNPNFVNRRPVTAEILKEGLKKRLPGNKVIAVWKYKILNKKRPTFKYLVRVSGKDAINYFTVSKEAIETIFLLSQAIEAIRLERTALKKEIFDANS